MYTCYIQSFELVSVAEQAGLDLTFSKIPEDTFSRDVAQSAFLCENYMVIIILKRKNT